MPRRSPAYPDSGVLPEAAAERLLARASELDAARRRGAAVSDLRAAAEEAGISPQAFDAALAELNESDAATRGADAHGPTRAPRVLTIRATPERLERVKAAIAEHERAGSPACATSPATAAPP